MKLIQATFLNCCPILLGWAVSLLVLSGMCLHAQGTLTSLGDLDGQGSYATAINNSGEVVGYSTAGLDVDHAFLYSSGTITDLGTLGGYQSKAYGINDSGEIVGYTNTDSGAAEAFEYSNGTMTGLGSETSFAFGINNYGQITGLYSNAPPRRSFIDSEGAVTDLGDLGGGVTEASAINNSGQIVGDSWNGSSLGHAFLYSNGTMTNLGTLGGNTSQAQAINNSGQIVGVSAMENGSSLAFLYSNGQMTLLNGLGATESDALGINDSGMVVGNADNEAFLYSPSGGMQYLNNLFASLLVSGTGPQAGFTSLTNATAINDEGQIVGEGTYWTGTSEIEYEEAFLLTPESVPEPSGGLTGLLAGAAFFLLRAASRRGPNNVIS